TELKIIGVEEDAAKVAIARKALDHAGLYGVRVSVHHGSLANLPYGNYLANLIVSDNLLLSGELPGDAAEMYRCLRPCGGVAYLGQPKAASGKRLSRSDLGSWLKKDFAKETQIKTTDGLWAVIRRGVLPGAGDWTDQYGSADNSTCSKDELVKGEMDVLWWGEPGPRPMPDRGARNPAPVSANGRLFVQGDRILFGMDAYNGTILWTLAAPELRRTNIPRDCSNMAASDDYLYIAKGQYACGLNAQTGARDLKFKVPQTSDERPYDWGYVSSIGDSLLGSAVKKGSAYVGDDGEWYDSTSPNDVSNVTSDYLFALDRHQGKQRWLYQGGVVLNSTITVGDGVVHFIESRNPAAKAHASGRMNREVFTHQFLVALDLRTGRKLWEQPVDFSRATRMLYLAYGRQTLTVIGSSQQDYHLWAFDTKPESQKVVSEQDPAAIATTQLWEQHYPMARDHHGGAVQHPLIVGDVLYSEKRAFNLRTGVQLRDDLPERRGCGTMSASQNSLFFRHYFHGMWDLQTDRRTEFQGIRSGCWLSMIPSGGLVLAPESSSGCSCTHSIQTSVAYIPKASAKSNELGEKATPK
ncbi:MAG TPA: PQQ-binding-like beta-propeller repeat protein, partial [Candidatus Eisenbacteria bacterium]|nr:PQQ-binding-like beta-propeller repeat protein [Candidatus Eisenbacteria bacterium]